jgi:hypothetical protein
MWLKVVGVIYIVCSAIGFLVSLISGSVLVFFIAFNGCYLGYIGVVVNDLNEEANPPRSPTMAYAPTTGGEEYQVVRGAEAIAEEAIKGTRTIGEGRQIMLLSMGYSKEEIEKMGDLADMTFAELRQLYQKLQELHIYV